MTEVTIKPAETGPTPPAPAPDPNRPAWLPDNFTKPEDFATSYKELQAKFTQTAQELAALKKPGEQTTETPPVTETSPAPDGAPKDGEQAPDPNAPKDGEKKPEDKQAEAAQKVADAAGFDLGSFQTEYDTTGDVSEENRAKIAEGLKAVLGDDTRAIVDQFIEGRKATDANDHELFSDAAGGDQQYATMIAWAAQNLPAPEIDAYNKAIDSRDRHATLFAIAGLKERYGKANGLPGNIITPGGGGAAPVVGYSSAAEMTLDMAKPEYKTNPAFREQVRRKIAAGTV